MFTLGAAVGSVATWKFVKDRYEKIAQEEIDAIRDFYYEQETAEKAEEDESDDEEDEDERKKYEEMMYAEGYLNEEQEGAEKNMVEPYVISPDEFDEMGYETVTLYCYADNVVETMLGKDVLSDDEVEDWITSESLTHFGEFEEDSVFVRNDNMKTDFEILRVSENYYSED
jgi:hypothetical protein